jgi:hypothetical protein
MVFPKRTDYGILLYMKKFKSYSDGRFVWDYIPFGWKLKRGYFNFKRFVIDIYQKITKGYADSETWSLDYSLAKWVVPRLKHLRDNVHGTPPNLEIEIVGDNDRYTLTLDEWKSKLDEMIYAFEFVLTEDDILEKCYPPDFKWGFHSTIDGKIVWEDDRKPDYTYYDECQKKYLRGLELFKLYFRHLWD